MTPGEYLGWAAVLEGADPLTLEEIIGLPRPAFMSDAACRGSSANFFPERGQSSAPAKLVCRGCPVLEDCRAWALDDPHPAHGILAGLSPRERTVLRRRRAA